MDCNQTRVPILFLQDVNGFMVGRDSEQAGIIRAGAKLVNVDRQQRRAEDHGDPRRLVRRGQLRPVRQGVRPAVHLRLADGAGTPSWAATRRRARCWTSQVSALKRAGNEPDAAELEELRDKVEASYEEQTDMRYAAARLWVDAIIDPEETRAALLTALAVATRYDEGRPFKTGVLQV